MISSILIGVGIALTVFGLWAVWATRDPLGYSPPVVYWFPLVGMFIGCAGIIWKVVS